MAADARIVIYIREQMDAGFRKAQICEALLQAGWYKDEIDEAFYSIAREIYSRPEPMAPDYGAQPAVQASPLIQEKELPKNPGFFWKLRNVLLRPGRFFDAVKNEKDMGNSLSFYGLFYFIHLVFFIGIYMMEIFLETDLMDASAVQAFSSLIPMLALQGVLLLFFGYLIMLSIPFVAALVTHLFVYLMGGRKGFFSTFKSVSYSLAPTLLMWPIIAVFYFTPELMVQGFDIFSLAYQALLFILSIWVLYLLIRGLKRFHEISGIRAFLSVFIPLAIAVMVAVAFVLSALMALIYYGPLANGAQSQGLAVIDFNYKSDGSFSLALRDLQEPLTINTVSVGCGENDAYIDLDTAVYTHLEPGDNIQYSTGENKCLPRDPGERYSVVVSVRYIDKENYPNNFYKSVEGNVS